MRFSTVIFAVLVSTSFGLLLTCKSKNQSDESLAGVSTRQVQELELPAHPYRQDYDTHFYVGDKKIIAHIARSFGVDNPLITVLIRDIRASVHGSELFSVVINTSLISQNRKKALMRKLGAETLDEQDRFWKIENKESVEALYIDIQYKNALIINNTKAEDMTTFWTWTLPTAMSNSLQDGEGLAWLWTANQDIVGNFQFEGFGINWIMVHGLKYIADNNIMTTLAMHYRGDKSTQTTLKLLIPLLIKSFEGVDLNSSLPHMTFIEDVLLMEGLIFTEEYLWRFFERGNKF